MTWQWDTFEVEMATGSGRGRVAPHRRKTVQVRERSATFAARKALKRWTFANVAEVRHHGRLIGKATRTGETISFVEETERP